MSSPKIRKPKPNVESTKRLHQAILIVVQQTRTECQNFPTQSVSAGPFAYTQPDRPPFDRNRNHSS